MPQPCSLNSAVITACDTTSGIPVNVTATSIHCVSDNSPYVCPTPSDTAFVTTTGDCTWCSTETGNRTTVGPTSSTTPSSILSTDTTITSQSNANSGVTSPTNSHSSTTSATISSGTILTPGLGVGIGLGCALAGALLAGFIAFVLFCRKRRQRSHPQPQPPFNGVEYVGQEKYGIVATDREVRGATATNFERLLPLPAEDDAIIGGLSKIRDSIKNHVQNYYHTGPISPEGVDELRLAELSQATGIPTSALLNLLFNPATRFPTIRLFLGHLILSRLQGRIDGQASFLPNEVSLLAASQSSASANSSQALLFSKWKTISGVLLQPKYGEAPGESDVRNGNIAQILAAAEPVLHPFINPNTDTNARQHHLEGIMRRAAQFAFLLFSQPGSFSFDFRGPGEASSLLVFPVFLQTVSDEAEILSPPRLLSGGEVLSGLGM